MPSKWYFRLWQGIKAISLVCLMSGIMNTYAESGDEALKHGIELMKQQRYDAARQVFETVYKQGNRSPLLYFNVGVTYFKLQQHKLAIKSFEKLKDTPLSDIGALNEGLCWEAIGNAAKARKNFKIAYASKNEKIRKLASDKLGMSPVQPSQILQNQNQRPFDMSGLLDYTFGQDDYIRLIDEDLNQPSSSDGIKDDYTQIFASLNIKLPHRFTLFTRYLDIAYNDNASFDFNYQKFGLKYQWPLEQWTITPTLETFQSTVSGLGYQKGKNISISADARTDIDSIRITYLFSSIDADDPIFIGGEGNKRKLSVDYSPNITPDDSIRLGYQFEKNSRRNTSERSYSPTRHSATFVYTHRWNQRLDSYIDFNYQKSQYSQIRRSEKETHKDYNFSRYEHRRIISIGSRWRFNRYFSTDLRYSTTESASNLENSDYDRNILSLSFKAGFTTLFLR